MISVCLLGAGNVATHLYQAFNRARDITITQWYNRDLKKTSYSLNINQSTITKKSIDAFGKDSTEYEVHLSYPLTKNINLLSVKKTKETHESLEFIIKANDIWKNADVNYEPAEKARTFRMELDGV